MGGGQGGHGGGRGAHGEGAGMSEDERWRVSGEVDEHGPHEERRGELIIDEMGGELASEIGEQ